MLHAGSQVGGPTDVAPVQDENTGKRLIRSLTKKEAEGETKKKLKKTPFLSALKEDALIQTPIKKLFMMISMMILNCQRKS